MAEPTMVNKVTLSSGKTVLLRELQIKHTEQAAQAAAPRAGNNNTVLGIMMQKELIKLLIVAIDDQPVSAAKLENLDGLFSLKEYSQLLMVVKKLTGDEDDLGNFQIEVVSSGTK